MEEHEILKYLGWAIGFLGISTYFLDNPRNSIYTFTGVMTILFATIIYKWSHGLVEDSTAWFQLIFVVVISYLNFKYKSIEIARIEEEERKSKGG